MYLWLLVSLNLSLTESASGSLERIYTAAVRREYKQVVVYTVRLKPLSIITHSLREIRENTHDKDVEYLLAHGIRLRFGLK